MDPVLAAIIVGVGLYLASRVFNSLLKKNKEIGFMLALDLLDDALKTTKLPVVRLPGQPVLIPEIVVFELTKAMRAKYKKDGAPGDPPRLAGA